MQPAKSLENYNRLRAAFQDDEQFNAITVYISDQHEASKIEKQEQLATKTDVIALKSDIKAEIGALEIRLNDRMAELKSDTIKWVAILVIGQISAITAINFLLFKHA